MKKLLISAFLVLFCSSAFAEGVFSTKVYATTCKEVARSGGVTGAVAGGTVGAGAGAVVGGFLFGKKGAAIGGALGGIGGGVAGERAMGTATYSCVLKVTNMKGQYVFVETLGGSTYQVNQRINVYPIAGGGYAVQ